MLAILALLLLPLRGLCHLDLPSAAHAAGERDHVWHGDGKLDPCCASIHDGAMINSVVPDLSGGPGGAPFVPLLLSLLILTRLANGPLRLAIAPSPPRSYYARSARILR
ncbi:MAG TPA: hypothetical protein VH867_06310 [Burkholderiales bacterium]